MLALMSEATSSTASIVDRYLQQPQTISRCSNDQQLRRVCQQQHSSASAAFSSSSSSTSCSGNTSCTIRSNLQRQHAISYMGQQAKDGNMRLAAQVLSPVIWAAKCSCIHMLMDTSSNTGSLVNYGTTRKACIRWAESGYYLTV